MPIKDTVVNRILFMLIMLLTACGKSTLAPEAYVNWIDDKNNGCIKSETIGKIKYTVIYRPSDYSIAKGYLNKRENYKTIVPGQHHSFVVKMEPLDGKTPVLTIDAKAKEEPFERINYYLNEAQYYIEMTEGKDTMPVNNYIYERYYNLSPDQSLVLGFDQKYKLGEKEITLIIEDKIFNTGKVAFNFSESTLNKIPQLRHDDK